MGLEPRLAYRLERGGLEVEFARILCGRGDTFFKRWTEIQERARKGADAASSHARLFVALSEWDAVVLRPTNALYPANRAGEFVDPDLARALSGKAGFFNYVWRHPVNHAWRDLLRPGAPRTRVGLNISVRFHTWIQARYGLAAEYLFLDAVRHFLQERGLSDRVRLVVGHSLGWYDATVFVFTEPSQAKHLADLIYHLRYLTPGRCGGSTGLPPAFVQALDEPDLLDTAMVAATYSHLLVDVGDYLADNVDIGTLAARIESARVLVRTDPCNETRIRNALADLVGDDQARPAIELGRYNLSLDLSDNFDGAGGFGSCLEDIRALRGAMAREDGTLFSTGETCTIFRYRSPRKGQAAHSPRSPSPPADLERVARTIEERLANPDSSGLGQGANAMIRHRVTALLQVLLSHLHDPVRGPAVLTLARRITDQVDRLFQPVASSRHEGLVQVLELALGQATDGLNQFQYDTHSLGLAGPMGYARLSQVVTFFADSFFSIFDIEDRPIITFGLSPDYASTVDGRRIDIPFSVLFVMNRWYVLLHELGHICWNRVFDWRSPTWAPEFEGFQELVMAEYRTPASRSPEPDGAKPTVGEPPPAGEGEQRFLEILHVKVLRVIRELFPQYLALIAAFCGDLERFAARLLRHQFRTASEPSILRGVQHLGIVIPQLQVFEEVMDEMGGELDRTLESVSTTAVKWRLDDVPQDVAVDHGVKWWRTWHERVQDVTGQDAPWVLDRVQGMVKILREALVEESDREGRPARLSSERVHLLEQTLSSHVFEEVSAQGLVAVVAGLRNMFAPLLESAAPPPTCTNDDRLTLETYGRLLLSLRWLMTGSGSHLLFHPGRFSEALREGTVLAVAPASPVLLELMNHPDMDLGRPDSGEFTTSQLAAILSLWHRAVLTGSGDGGLERACQDLQDLGYLSRIDLPSGPERG